MYIPVSFGEMSADSDSERIIERPRMIVATSRRISSMIEAVVVAASNSEMRSDRERNPPAWTLACPFGLYGSP